MENTVDIYLCDDDVNFISVIKTEIQKTFKSFGRKNNIQSFNKGSALLKTWNKKFADAVFIDIEMPIMDGFQLAEQLKSTKPDALIIFVTSYEDKVYQSWELQPFWFVRKSHLDDLEIVLPRLLVKIDAEREKKNHMFNLMTENKIIQIDISTLKYIQSYKHYIIFYDKFGGKVQARCKISDAEKQLSHLYFIRVQSGYIVNCRFISKITSRDVILISGECIHMSRDRIENIKNEFQRFIRSR